MPSKNGGKPATQADLKAVKNGLQAVKNDLKGDLQAFKAELKGDIKRVALEVVLTPFEKYPRIAGL